MDDSGKSHALAALSPVKTPGVRVDWEAGWTADFASFGEESKTLAFTRI
jgi:hypothetical protein